MASIQTHVGLLGDTFPTMHTFIAVEIRFVFYTPYLVEP